MDLTRTDDGYEPTDIGLDPSDPLNLIIKDDAQTPSSGHASPMDWSQLSSLWSSNPYMDAIPTNMNLKYPDIPLDFNVLDMDFNPSMSVDPTALHYDPQSPYINSASAHASFGLTASSVDSPFTTGLSRELFSTGLPLTFTPVPGPLPARRLSITSSSSSSVSGASLSPVIDGRHSTPSAESTNGNSPSSDAADELAERVRKSAGVMLAVPGGVLGQPTQLPMTKLAIPRLAQQPKTPVRPLKRSPIKPASSSSASASSSPGPEDSAPAPVPNTSVIGRPKTSHTTIERRYRTNLNARIQSLRAAVPALRVLDEKTNKNISSNAWGDVVDERSFVDGVKVARKGSKASILGKAVEYIRVLKKREARLKREQNGLKSLLCGLVGGPALLKEWEREWREKFGGEEKDEIEGEEAEVEPASDEEFEGTADAEEDVAPPSFEVEEQEGEGRPMKKAKVVTMKEGRKEKERKGTNRMPQRNELNVTMHLQSPVSVVPEKRKRGRPRKAVTQHLSSSESPESSPFANEHSHVHGLGIIQLAHEFGQGQAGQCLLATFAMFSFFSSPLTTTTAPAETAPWAASHAHSHTGFVLGHSQAAARGTLSPRATWGWRDAVQLLHLSVSVLVLLSVVLPWLPMLASRWKRLRLFTARSSSSSQSVLKESEAVTPATLDGPPEAQKLRKTLGLDGWLGWFGAWRGMNENRSANRKAWVNLGEVAAMNASTPTLTRLQIYWCMSSPLASASELATRALVIRPLLPARAALLWAEAAQRGCSFERMVLSEMSVEDAAARLAEYTQSKVSSEGEEERVTPMDVLARVVLFARMKEGLGRLFVRSVMTEDEDARSEEEEEEGTENQQWKETIDASRSLGGWMAEFAETLEAARNSAYDDDKLSISAVPTTEAETDVRALLRGLVLYRRVFPAPTVAVSSPPLNPNGEEGEIHLALRQALGASVFERKGEDGETLAVMLEDARDRVVDMLIARPNRM